MVSPIRPILHSHIIAEYPHYDYWRADLAFGVHTTPEDTERQLALPELGNTFPDDFERSSTVSTTTDGSESSLFPIPRYVAGLVSYDSFRWVVFGIYGPDTWC
ncbi:hypothetical protein B0H14DRAFT_2619986 [Mycena olivaceomarginata]|nr:hypothetical protein B0H14DRAFT_2619986 [Mycena olivaceomarginata]